MCVLFITLEEAEHMAYAVMALMLPLMKRWQVLCFLLSSRVSYLEKPFVTYLRRRIMSDAHLSRRRLRTRPPQRRRSQRCSGVTARKTSL